MPRISPNDPYRVLVWGPGGLGRVAIKEIALKEEFELAGLLAFSEHKRGRDAGELAGIEPLGVRAVVSLDEALAIDCDCVLHLTRDHGRYESLDGILAFLRAGRNVVTVHPYHHSAVLPETSAPAGTAEMIAEACAEGGTTFHATGIHPEMICNRMAATLTGLTNDVQSVKVFENWDQSQYNKKTLSVIGFGRPPEEMEARPAVARMTNNYCLQNLHGMSRALGVQLERTEIHHDYAPAPRDLTFPLSQGETFEVAAGTVGRLTHTLHGFRRADDEQPFVTLEVNWMLGREDMVPKGMPKDVYYVVEVEGRPSLSMGITLQSSIAKQQQLMDPDDKSSEPGYWSTIAPVLQAVPIVCAAAPGYLEATGPEVHWMDDLRRLVRSAEAAPVGSTA